MTSSLVGSEMCIRDRRDTLCRHLRREGCTNPCRSPRGMWAQALGRRAVSYTHLTLPTICSV
eukprot:4510634-Prorocentrum_lima.AAC.1